MSATVFKRPGGCFYVRLFPSGQEIWASLRTKDPTIASLRAAVLTGRIASAKLVQSGGQSMTRADMKEIVKQFVKDIIERGEEDRASRTKLTENERKPHTTVCPMPSTRQRPTTYQRSDSHHTHRRPTADHSWPLA